MKVQANLKEIQKNISEACAKAGRDPKEVTIIGVTKYVSVERADEAVEAGVNHLGENRIEGLKEKSNELSSKDVIWHFIGSLQSKKVKHVVNEFDFLHSLDRLSLAKEINKRAEQPVSCFIQVNTSGEASKHGLAPTEVIDFVQKLQEYPQIQIIGLMTMAPLTDDEAALRDTFRQLRLLRDNVQDLKLSYAPCSELSMGMSNDYGIAIEEGATYIRIGSNLVG
ncbi:YggS family pyridoxal phosphate-dependent enzyme [Paraliobacillus salinarum]|uniref:YggS family pyridoxal phosphate-dependent enzyme n=1 Tax=Paraliobacillus salinarum TaxID=1158996 RepID=UPI0015F63935|nr:YggS family pyridoxal phosphate-dependent enzyme [Paraliobacillus salinarum]